MKPQRKTTYGEWQAKDDDTTFDAVTSPEIEHYTADKPTVEEVTGLTPESKDSEVGQDEQIKINRCLDMPVLNTFGIVIFQKNIFVHQMKRQSSPILSAYF